MSLKRIHLRIALASGGLLIVFGLSSVGNVKRTLDESALETIVVIDGIAYDRQAFADFLRRPPRFATEQDALVHVEAFVLRILLDQAAAAESERVGRRVFSSELVESEVRRVMTGHEIAASEVERRFELNRASYTRSRAARFTVFEVRPDRFQNTERVARALYRNVQMNLAPESFGRFVADTDRSGIRVRTIGPLECDARSLPDGVRVGVLARACALRKGGLSQPFNEEGAWYVVRRLDDLPPRNVPPSLAKARIRAGIEREARALAAEKFERTLRDRAEVQIRLEEVRTMIRPPAPAPAVLDGPPTGPIASYGEKGT